MLCVGFRPLVLESERLLFRPGRPEDAQRLTALLDWEVLKYFDFIHYPYDQAAAERYLERVAENHTGSEPGLFMLEERGRGLLIGEAWVLRREGTEDFALGYWLGAPFQGKGYGKETVGRLIAYGRDELGVTALHANVAPQNKRSSELLKGFGFKPNGREERPESRAGNSYVERWLLEL